MSVTHPVASLVAPIHLRVVEAMDGRSSVLEAIYAIAVTLLEDGVIDERAHERLREAMRHVPDGGVQSDELRAGASRQELHEICDGIIGRARGGVIADDPRALLAADIMSLAPMLAACDPDASILLRMIDRQAADPAHDRTPAIRSALGLSAPGPIAEMVEAEEYRLLLARLRAPRDLSAVTRYLTLTPTCDDGGMHDTGSIRVTGLLVALAERAGLDPKVMLRELIAWGGGKGWGWRRMDHMSGMGAADRVDPPSSTFRDGILDLSLPLRDMTVTSEAACDRVAVLVRQLPPPSVVNLLPGEHVSVLFGDAFPLAAPTATIISATYRESIGRLSVIVNCPSVTL